MYIKNKLSGIKNFLVKNKYTLIILLGFVIFFCCIALYLFFKPHHTSKYYYDLLKSQEIVMDTTTITGKDKKILYECKSDECFRSFYDAYTMKYGVEEAFSHLALFQKQTPNNSAGCHYISHGIGHASLRLNKNNLTKAFDVMTYSSYFKNIATCGNGYFHGVIEEYAKDVSDKDGLVKLFLEICKFNSYCFHGIGHASFIQLNRTEDPIKESLYVCDQVTVEPNRRFNCYTGVFMEATTFNSVRVEKGVMHFVACDKESDRTHKAACYLEQSSLFEKFTKEPRNYTRNMGFCKQIADPLNRVACVKLFAIRSVRISKFEDIKAMCLNTSSKPERIMCTAVTADKLASSLDVKAKGYDYNQIVWDICSSILNPVDRVRCYGLASVKKGNLFLVTDKDLQLEESSDLRTVYSLFKEHSFLGRYF